MTRLPDFKTALLAACAALFLAPVMAAEPGSSRTTREQQPWIETGFGPLAAPVMGDFTAGPHMSLIRFPAGFASPVHTHSATYYGVVAAGTARHYEPGRPETETVLTPGSTWVMPGGLPHVSECLPGAECIFVLYQDEPLDFHVTE
jgi:quercetin dioxygenase-like cupin family protein